MKIIFIQTEGTIDKDYPHTTKGWAFEFGEPATHRILEKLNPSFEHEVVTSCRKDSLEITEEDRENIADLIEIINWSGALFLHANYISDVLLKSK